VFLEPRSRLVGGQAEDGIGAQSTHDVTDRACVDVGELGVEHVPMLRETGVERIGRNPTPAADFSTVA
jgi:hypothetical protein